jgi:UDP-N-acetylglucosamine--N-acetylmuramyl-(pentapeptide) pyrophosphoryl-undecaprenol N-acetylglucosamine transferase
MRHSLQLPDGATVSCLWLQLYDPAMVESGSKTIFFAGGGTGGHLYPGIAVAEALRKIAPEIRCLFLCTTREIDRVILEPAGFEFIEQPIERPSRSIGGLLKFWKSWRETKELARKSIKERSPAVVVGLGGYAAGAAVRVAQGAKIPTALINPDVIPGKANYYLMKPAAAVCCQFKETEQHVSTSRRANLIVTGCPIRSDFLAIPSRAQAAANLGLDPSLKTLTITGASQGAATINEALPLVMAQIQSQGWQILHLSGRSHSDKVREAYAAVNVPARVIDFTPAMADVWAATDLAVSRSGASTCAELTACGIPSVLMPYPFHRDQHQRFNAKVLADGGAAVLLDDLRDAKQNAEKLKPILEPLIRDEAKRNAMAAAAKTMGRPHAAEAVAKVVIGFVK